MAQKFLTEITLQALNNATTDTDKFLVSDGGTIKFRTGSQVLSDIGAQAVLTNPITGTGTTSYLPKFTGTTSLGNSQVIDNGFSVKYQNKAYYNTIQVVGTSGTVKWTLQDSNGNNVTTSSTNKVYRIQLVTTPTGTNTGATWIASNVDAAGWNVKLVNANVTGISNYPYMIVDTDGLPKVTMIHPNNYNVSISVEEFDGTNNGTTTGVFGLDDSITALGGSIGIGTTTPGYTLDVNGPIRTSTGYIIGANTNADINIDGTIGSRLRYLYQSITLDSSNATIKTNNTARLFINNAGDVGIGTTSPSYLLDIVGTSNTFASIGTTGASSGRALLFQDKKTTATKYNWLIGSQYNIDNAFEITPSTTIGGSTYSSPSITILQSGNVGIGTTSPSYTLHVGGTIYASSDFRAPIFYDSNDTTYYLDPANTTTALNAAGKVVINLGSSSGTPILQATGTYGTMSLNTYYGLFHTSGDFYIGNPAGGAANLTGAQANFNLFSDRNNSAYYADPSATSNFVGLTVANTISGNITGNAGTVSTITNRTNLMVNSLAAPALIDGLTGANFRSTLFGTTSNGYQISTARWNTTPSILSGIAPYSTMIAWAGSDTQGFLAMDYSSPAARMGGGNANNINWTRRVLLEDAWTNGKYFGSGSQIYASVYYDANDSSFYFEGSNYGDSIRVAGDIVAYYSDERLKDKKGNIENALEKVLSLNGFYYEPNEIAQSFGYKKKLEVGVSAQEVEVVLPEIVKDAAIGRGYKTLDYGKLTPLLIEAVKEQQKQIEELKELVNKLINK